MNTFKSVLTLSIALVSMHPYPQDNEGAYAVHRKCKAKKHTTHFKLDQKQDQRIGRLHR